MPNTILRRLREKQDIKLADMAKEIGTSPSFLRMVETHPKFLAPNHPIVSKLARALGVTETVVKKYAKRAPLAPVDIARSNERLGKPRPRAAKKGRASPRRGAPAVAPAASHVNGTRANAIDISALDKATRDNPGLRAAVRAELIRSVERIFG